MSQITLIENPDPKISEYQLESLKNMDSNRRTYQIGVYNQVNSRSILMNQIVPTKKEIQIWITRQHPLTQEYFSQLPHDDIIKLIGLKLFCLKYRNHE